MTPLPLELIKEFRETAQADLGEGDRVMVAIAHHYGLNNITAANVGKYWNYLTGLMRQTNPDWWRCA